MSVLMVFSGAILGAILNLFAPQFEETTEKTITSAEGVTLDVICVTGVEYLYKDTYNQKVLAPRFKPDGTLYRCE